MKALRMSLVLIILFSLMSGICYGQTAEDFLSRGRVYFNQGMYDRAIAEFKKALEINSKMDLLEAVPSWRSLTECLTACQVSLLASLEKDIEAFEKILSSVGDDCQPAKRNLQVVMQKENKHFMAISNISKMVQDTTDTLIDNIK